MKRTKMSLANIQGKLSRTEMKNIMAGSGVIINCKMGSVSCTSDLNCSSQGTGCKCNTLTKKCYLNTN